MCIRDSIEVLSQIKSNDVDGFVVAVDQAFTVKGVGLVAIGHVQSGKVNKHDELILAGSEGNAIARSLQVMDLDVDVANIGDRVGLAMRTAGPFREDLLGKGSILADSNERFTVESKSRFQLDKAAFQKNDLTKDDVVHLCCDLQFIVGRVSEVSDFIHIDWDFPIVLNKSSKRNPLIVQLEANPRIMGSAKFN